MMRSTLTAIVLALTTTACPAGPQILEDSIVDPCDPAIDQMEWTEENPFAGWRPPTCFEAIEVAA